MLFELANMKLIAAGGKKPKKGRKPKKPKKPKPPKAPAGLGKFIKKKGGIFY